jgi:rhodanese-related sulfurtransferase
MTIKKIAAEIAAVTTLSFVLGTAVHLPLIRRFFAGEFRSGFLDREKYPDIRFVTLAEAEDLFSQGAGAAVFLDSRRGEDFAAGHIAGARSIPLNDHKQGLPDGILAYPLDHTLVVYCEGGDCQTSIALAKLIRLKGFRDIRIFSGGWAEWSAAGLPTEASN